MKKIFTPIVVIGLLLVFGACATNEPPTPEEASEIISGTSPIAFDDPKAVFGVLFPAGIALEKEKLETTAEYHQRLAKTGLEGREFVFLIPPQQCDVFPFPDQDFYVIVSQDTFYDGWQVDPVPYGMTIMERDDNPHEYAAQNAFGATARVTAYSGTKWKLCPDKFLKLPRTLRWTQSKDSGFMQFGLPIRIHDPAFRELLKAKKIGLAVKVRIGDLTKIQTHFQGSTATITNPYSFTYEEALLPVQLEQAWIVNTTSGTSLVTWHPATPSSP